MYTIRDTCDALWKMTDLMHSCAYYSQAWCQIIDKIASFTHSLRWSMVLLTQTLQTPSSQLQSLPCFVLAEWSLRWPWPRDQKKNYILPDTIQFINVKYHVGIAFIFVFVILFALFNKKKIKIRSKLCIVGVRSRKVTWWRQRWQPP